MFQKKLLALLVLFLVGCTNQTIIEKEVEKQYQWQRKTGLDFEHGILTNSYATEDYFFAMGYTNFISMVNDSLLHPDAHNQSNFTRYSTRMRLKSATKFLLTAHYYVYTHPSGTVAIVPNANPVTSRAYRFLRMSEIDPAFKEFYSPIVPFLCIS